MFHCCCISRLLFAGEHTSNYMGSAAGAYLSGLREAERIVGLLPATAAAACTASTDCPAGLVCDFGPSTTSNKKTKALRGKCATCVPLYSAGCSGSFTNCCQNSKPGAVYTGATRCLGSEWCWDG